MKKIAKNKKFIKYVVLTVILLIPFMYSFFYLKAFWNPYGSIDEIPVAIVNLDQKVNNVNRGQELVDLLIEKDTLDIKLVSVSKAEEGLQDKTYYAVITIPKNFTSNLESINSKDRQLTTITYTPNQKTNYLASQIISRVMIEVELELKSNISSEVVGTLTDNINTFPNKIEEIENGLKEINNGIYSVKDGIDSLESGLSNLQTNYQKFNDGLTTLGNGNTKLVSSLTNLKDGLTNLESGVSSIQASTNSLGLLSSSISNLTNSHTEFTTGLSTYTDSISSVSNAYDLLVSNICTAEGETSVNCLTAKGLQSSLSTLVTSGTTIKNSNLEINEGIKLINSKSSNLGNINTAITSVKNSVTALKTGASSILDGSNNLQTGLTTLISSSNQIKDGIDLLKSGSNQLQTGANTLYTKTSEAIDTIDSNLATTKDELTKLEGLSDYVKSPIDIEEKDVNSVKKYGIAFAPYFMSLSLWVGALMLFVVLYYDVKDRFTLFSRNNKSNVKRTLGYMGLATVQAIVLGFLLKLGLGFNTTNIFLYYGSLILTANAFLLIIEFLIINFDDVGKFVVILFLVLQLASSGGTFPIETVPTFFRNLYNYMPMKYSIGLFKEAIITSDSKLILENTIVLLMIAIFSLIIIGCATLIKKKFKNK